MESGCYAACTYGRSATFGPIGALSLVLNRPKRFVGIQPIGVSSVRLRLLPGPSLVLGLVLPPSWQHSIHHNGSLVPTLPLVKYILVDVRYLGEDKSNTSAKA